MVNLLKKNNIKNYKFIAFDGSCMDMKNNKTKLILDYLYKLEFFSPYMPNGDNKVYDSNSKKPFSFENLFTDNKKNNTKGRKIYTIYVGIFNFKKSITNIHKALNLEDNYDERSSTKSIICGFKLNEKGEYIEDTFSICNFVYAVNEILKHSSTEVELSEKNVSNFAEELLKIVNPNDFTPSKGLEFLNKLYNILKENFPLVAQDISDYFVVYQETIYKEDEENLATPAILSSFYVKDLDMVRNDIDQKIEHFLSLKPDEHIEIDKDYKQMENILKPENYPLGKWPSKYHPCLMQQLAINLVRDGIQPIFSVNGPPGTGKTTLVKEVIVSSVVDRAIEMLNYEKPDDAFTKTNLEWSSNQYITNYYKLNEKLSKYGILVVSNNNTAVENISLELPLSKDVKSSETLTKLFDTDINKEIYFTDIANSLYKDGGWGMISARLGKKKNIDEFKEAIWFSKENKTTLKDYIDNYIDDFKETKERFKKKLDEVNSYREFLKDAYNDVKTYETNKEKYLSMEAKISEVEEELSLIKTTKQKIENEINILKEEAKEYENLKNGINKKIPFYMKIFFFCFKQHPYFIKLKDLKQKCLSINEQIFKSSEDLIDKNRTFNECKNILHKHEEDLENFKKDQQKLEIKIAEYKNQEIVIGDTNYYLNIENNKNSQEKAIWTNKYYDKLREELFYEALRFQKSFILSSKAFKTNIRILINCFKGTVENKIQKECYKDVFNTLFLFVPVISTTLASVQKLLNNIPKNSIGTVIVDEAGQATPASVIGTLYRAKKILFLGDPFQVEPVVTIPNELYYILDYKKRLPNIFHDSMLSAQVVADMQNKYGGLRGEDKSIWVGCPLRLHRRCINPMFNISNKIAYDDKMFYFTENPKDAVVLSMDNSKWLDIKGEEIRSGNHYIKEQGNKALDLFINALKANNNELPSLFIITPFRTVAHEMKKELSKYLLSLGKLSKDDTEKWVNQHCGTIHTFQGKEANEVIILLGCSKKSTGAVNWAASKPNILNVAVTRAKYRVTIIGDATIWKDVPYFNEAYKQLKSK